MKKKKRVRFDKIKIGEYFKYCNIIYRKTGSVLAIPLTGKTILSRVFWDEYNVIPVTIMIKVKEKK